MLDTAILAFTTLFATIGPLDVAAMFAVLTAKDTPKMRRRTAYRSTMVATIILLLFALLGELMLRSLGMSLAALQIGGGILLLLIGIEMAFAISSGATSTTDEETQEAATRQDIAIFPLATPLIAGPGAMGAVILLMADTEGVLLLQVSVVSTLLLMLLLTLVSMLLATHISRLLGVTGMHVISRVMGVLLTALAVQFILDGITRSGLLGSG
ncbi:MAG: MarC family protein [Gammaproteobacteria bacterium]|nr:MarC family protein [Gammaproteobacteria bacterium]MDH4316057.1 MarC family protein [Gammaproteobacteria bacterium]MDH5213917.1 MarC family protein [Gammaproteobacteria bacterium]